MMVSAFLHSAASRGLTVTGSPMHARRTPEEFYRGQAVRMIVGHPGRRRLRHRRTAAGHKNICSRYVPGHPPSWCRKHGAAGEHPRAAKHALTIRAPGTAKVCGSFSRTYEPGGARASETCRVDVRSFWLARRECHLPKGRICASGTRGRVKDPLKTIFAHEMDRARWCPRLPRLSLLPITIKSTSSIRNSKIVEGYKGLADAMIGGAAHEVEGI